MIASFSRALVEGLHHDQSAEEFDATMAATIAATYKASLDPMNFHTMFDKVKGAKGFLAALDQSGGSTPKALKAFGIPDDVSLVCLRNYQQFSC